MKIKLQGEKGPQAYQLLQQQQGIICIEKEIKKLNACINNNYMAQQFDFVIIYLKHNIYLSYNPMKKPLNLEKQKEANLFFKVGLRQWRRIGLGIIIEKVLGIEDEP